MKSMPENGVTNNDLPAPMTEMIEQALAKAAAPGAAVALLLDGQPLFASAVGFSDLARTTLLKSEAPFYIYSVTKSLIAALILRLVEEGIVGLDTAVQEYLPALPLATAVTLRQLLNHSGGLPDYGGLPAYYAAIRDDPAQPWTAAEFLAHTLPAGLLFAPGQGWAYSNIGYLLLRQVIEEISHSDLSTNLREHIFTPLGLPQAFVAETLVDAQRLTPGYSSFFSGEGELADVRPLYHPGWVSHGVVVASAFELACMQEAIFDGRLLAPSSQAAMLDGIPVAVDHPLFRRPAYGLGLMLDQGSAYGLIAGHAGGGPGYAAAALHLLDADGRRITSVALANRDADDLSLQIAHTMALWVAGNGVRTAQIEQRFTDHDAHTDGDDLVAKNLRRQFPGGNQGAQG